MNALMGICKQQQIDIPQFATEEDNSSAKQSPTKQTFPMTNSKSD